MHAFVLRECVPYRMQWLLLWGLVPQHWLMTWLHIAVVQVRR